MFELISKEDREFLNLALNGIHIAQWCTMGNFSGLVVKSPKDKLRYALNPKQWNTNLPPSFSFNDSISRFSPEFRIQNFIKAYYNDLRRITANNDWVKINSVINLNEKESICLFNLTGVGSHYLMMDHPPHADPYVSCHQIINAAEKKCLKRFKCMAEAELISIIGENNTNRLLSRVDSDKRTMMYLKMYQQCQTA